MAAFARFFWNCAVALNRPLPLAGVCYVPGYVRNWLRYARQARNEQLRISDAHPCFGDSTRRTPFDPHYFFQGAWLARRLAHTRPVRHLDIGSSVLTIGTLSGSHETVFVDLRPLPVRLSQLSSVAANIMRLPFAGGAVESLSCLHVIEHVGLGRYGDDLDPEGSRKAAEELKRILKPGGRLFLSVPVGRERVCFDAHRVFDPHTVIKMLTPLRVVSFGLVTDEGAYVCDAKLDDGARCEYGCGLFECTK